MVDPDDSLAWTRIVAERRIEEAMEQGLFDNLPGKGKPLNLDEDALTPPHLRIVHHVMKNGRVLPPWVALENEIEEAKRSATSFKERCAANSARRDPNSMHDSGAEYERIMRAAKHLILRFNLINPFVHRAPAPFRISEQLQDWDTRFSDRVPAVSQAG